MANLKILIENRKKGQCFFFKKKFSLAMISNLKTTKLEQSKTVPSKTMSRGKTHPMELKEMFAKYNLIRSYCLLRQPTGQKINNSIKNRQNIRKHISGVKIFKLQQLDKRCPISLVIREMKKRDMIETLPYVCYKGL